MILNKQELIESARPKDERTFLRFLETKIDQVLKYPPLLPYDISTTLGRLNIASHAQITFNDVEVKIEN